MTTVTSQTAPDTMTEGASGEFASFDDGYDPEFGRETQAQKDAALRRNDVNAASIPCERPTAQGSESVAVLRGDEDRAVRVLGYLAGYRTHRQPVCYGR